MYGLWGIFVLVPAVRTVETSLPDSLRSISLFSGPPLGVGMFAASLILAVMVVPFTSPPGGVTVMPVSVGALLRVATIAAAVAAPAPAAPM